MARKFRPLTNLEYDRWIENRFQYLKASHRGRIEYLAFAFYGALLPAISLLKDGISEDAILILLWLWGALALVASLVAAFAETNSERAHRYSTWLANYERELEQEKRFDETEAPKRKAWYAEELEKFRRQSDRS